MAILFDEERPFAESPFELGAYEELPIQGKCYRLKQAIAEIDNALEDSSKVLELAGHLQDNGVIMVIKATVNTSLIQKEKYQLVLDRLNHYQGIYE